MGREQFGWMTMGLILIYDVPDYHKTVDGKGAKIPNFILQAFKSVHIPKRLGQDYIKCLDL